MKIVHVIVGLDIGGAELMLSRLIKHHSVRNVEIQHQVISLTSLGAIGASLREYGIDVFCLNMKKTPVDFFSTIFQLRALFKLLKPDLIHSWMYHSDLLAGLAAFSLGLKNIIWCIRSTDITKGKNKVTIIIRKLCGFLSFFVPIKIVCAANASKKVHVSLGYDKTKMVVIPNGFDVRNFIEPSEPVESLRDELGVPESFRVVMSVGRYCNEKDHRTFLNAANSLLERYDDICFVLIGRNILSTNQNLASTVDSSLLNQKFYFIGERDDIARCLYSADVFCLHSVSEGFPNVLGEAMLAGKPCIATDVGDSGLMLDTPTWVTYPGDSVELASKLSCMLELTPTERFDLGAINKRRILDNFSMDSVSKKYTQLYKGLSNT